MSACSKRWVGGSATHTSPLSTARCSVRWGRRQSIYQLIRLRGAGHHLRTVTCYYWWTNHDDRCPCGQHRQDPPHWLFGCERTERPRQKFHEWYAKVRGTGEGARLAALAHQQQWAEVMGWLDGGGGWTEEERGVMLSAVLDFVDEVERISP